MRTLIGLCMDRPGVVLAVLVLACGLGASFAPFDWDLGLLPRFPVPVDAIPDLGENQQIVFTEWPGRSPRDVEDQVSFPLTSALLGMPKVKAVRCTSMFGFSIVYVVFQEGADFYWCRSRILEKLNSLPQGTLPQGVQPSLGPDATALGQVFWYTLEGCDPQGRSTGGWDLHELRSIQDWQVRFALLSAEGVSEVASIGGFVKEYQVDLDPALLRARGVTLEEVVAALQRANQEIGARTMEVNRVDYVVRGRGFVRKPEELADAIIKVNEGVPLLVRHVAQVSLGPAARSGVLDKEGAEAVGGVVVVRHGENPLQAIKNLRLKIQELASSLPRKTLADGTVSQVRIMSFYDRTQLIEETLWTLHEALLQEALVVMVVVLALVGHVRGALLVCSVLPMAVLLCFVGMKVLGVEANIVALSGIAIAIGTLGDMGIIFTENVLRHLERADPGQDRKALILRASSQVAGAVVAAMAATMVSFLPVFVLMGAEGKLFRPLAVTKTLVLLASMIVAVTVLPVGARLLLHQRLERWVGGHFLQETLVCLGLVTALLWSPWLGGAIALLGAWGLVQRRLSPTARERSSHLARWALVMGFLVLLSSQWLPLGPEGGLRRNLLFSGLFMGGALGLVLWIQRLYPRILGWCLGHKAAFLCLPGTLVVLGLVVWLGFPKVFGWLPSSLMRTGPMSFLAHLFPGLGKEFMPPVDEGSFLYMPTAMPHASQAELLEILQIQDRNIRAIPEVETVVGKLGRAESALDPAPLSMVETLIRYKPQYLKDEKGEVLSFSHDREALDLARDVEGRPLLAPDGLPYLVRGRFLRDERGGLVPEPGGRPFRLWRPPLDPKLNPGRDFWPGITGTEDIWDQILKAAEVPGVTMAPKLQPISARMVMLQSGIRASMGIKVKGPDLEVIEKACSLLEEAVREVPSVDPLSVIADRIMGVPYLEVRPDRGAMAQYGVDLQQLLDVLDVAVGGHRVATTVEGRERYPVRVRYLRELRDDSEALERVLVPTLGEAQVPLGQMAEIAFSPGPQMIRSEDTFLVGYVIFDRKSGFAEGDVFQHVQYYLRWKMESGALSLPAGVSISMTGNYENQVRAWKTLGVVVPVVLLAILVILQLQFSSAAMTGLVFGCLFVNWAGAFLLIWLCSRPWFLDFSFLGTPMREIFQVHPVNLSVAVWVGLIALFGGILGRRCRHGHVPHPELFSEASFQPRPGEGGGDGSREAQDKALHDDDGHHPFGPSPGAQLQGKRSGADAAHGHSFGRGAGRGNHNNADSAGGLLLGEGEAARKERRGSDMKGKAKMAGAFLLWAVCLFLGATLRSPQGDAEQAPSQSQLPGESRGVSGADKEGKAEALKWKDQEQKKDCEMMVRQVREHFLKAREFSIQGDSCSSEEEAGNFAVKLQKLKKNCPKGFVEQSGFTSKVVRNVKTLHSLGKERCGRKPTPHSPKTVP
ncbi:MAG: efflux RND transporter permease subunit [Thermodesulfobacteriota bacterium]